VAGGIFINYRRALNLKDAQLLQKGLQRHFGQRGVFLDVSGLDGGDHWLHTLEKQVDASVAMVALIGRGWADVADEKGSRRLDNPNDFVRFELARAFSRSLPVLPVLIDGADMPEVARLPTNLLPLTFPQAMHLRSQSLDDDADRIARRLRYLIAQGRPRGISYGAAGAGAVLALALGAAAGPMLLSGLGLPLPGVVLPSGETLRADLAAARDGLKEARRERDDLLVTIQKQADAASREKAQSTAMLAAATKARDEALAQAKDAKADAEEWRQKHVALSGEAKRKDEAAARERDGLRSELAASQGQLDAAKAAAAQSAAALSAATKARDEALAQAKSARAEADGWHLKLVPVAKAPPAGSDPALAVTPGSGQSFRDCNDGCPEMVVVPKGNFKQAFAVGKFEVTFDEWGACVAGGGCTGNPNPVDSGGWGKGRRPVINVSWDDAKEYVAWLSRKTGKTYRLLSDAEWEYAARAGTTTAYSWGDDIGKGNANCSSCGSQWGNKQTAPVGSFKPNDWGLFDMHGNVWEWCEDGDNSSRVLRGGAWNDNPWGLRSANRIGSRPSGRSSDFGFRLARTL
jgi:formylglycine-generating enzyme required for sulfatase activity